MWWVFIFSIFEEAYVLNESQQYCADCLLSRNRVLKIIFGPRRYEVTREWRKLHNDEVSGLYSTPRVIKLRKNEMGGHVASSGERRGVYRISMGKLEGKRPLGRRRHRWEDDIKMDLKEVWCGDLDWIELAENRDRWRAVVNAVMNLRVL